MSLRHHVLAGALALVAPVAATAQPVTGIYVGAGMGIDIPQHQTILDSGLVDDTLKINWGAGFAGVLSVGYGFGNGLRMEVEGSYRSSGVDRITGTDVANVSAGSQRNYGLMVNAAYDFGLGNEWVYPYVGAGIGYLWTDLDGFRLGAADARAFGISASGTDGSFAYQFMLGAAFPVRAVPGLAVTAEYRFLGTFDHESFDGYRINPKGVRTDAPFNLGTQQHSTILIGLRYAFGSRTSAP